MQTRAVATTLLIATISLISVLRLFTQTSDIYASAPATDAVTEFTARLAPLREMMPKTGVIGYMTDAGTPATDTGAQAEHHLIQYALAPVIVVNSPNQRFVIGNFHKPAATETLRAQGYRLIREFGSGIALFENERMK